MRAAICLLGLSLFLVSCGGGAGSSGSGSCNFQSGGSCSLNVNGVSRTYVLHVPSNLQSGANALVIAFHGANATGAQFESSTLLDQKAGQVGFAVAYPDGLPNSNGHTSWNGYFDPTYGSNAPDDSGFVQQLIQTLVSNLHTDPKRVYVTGMSAGGYMAHRAAIDHPDLIAAAGVVEGNLTVQSAGGTRQPPAASSSVSILILHGDADQVIPYCGVSNSSVVATSQDQTFNYWYQTPANACTTLNTSSNLCTGFLGSPTSVTWKNATGCNNGAEVRFYRLIGATHNWYHVPLNVAPGTASQPYNPNFNSATGVTTNDILWNFFASHAKP